MTAARPLPRYGAIEERARSRPCSDLLHHHQGHDRLQAIYLTDGGITPIAAYQLHQVLNVSFKTASSMIRRLQKAAAKADDQSPAGWEASDFHTHPATRHGAVGVAT